MSSHAADVTGGDARPPVAVIVCSRDRPGQLTAALSAVRAVLSARDELVVVDSASLDARAVAAAADDAGAMLVRNDRPGLSRARNAGVAASRSPLVAFTDDDCRPRAGWVDALARAFVDPAIGVVTGPVVGDAGGGVTVTTMTDDVPRRVQAGCDPMEVVHGANMSFRREALDAAGPFDELLGAGGRFRAAEDHDMVFRLLAAGWEGRYEPEAVVGHVQWRARRAVLRLELGYGIGSGAFVSKVLRTDPSSGRALLRRRVWTNGVASAARELAARHETAAAGSLLKATGVAIGWARARRIPLEGPNLRSD